MPLPKPWFGKGLRHARARPHVCTPQESLLWVKLPAHFADILVTDQPNQPPRRGGQREGESHGTANLDR